MKRDANFNPSSNPVSPSNGGSKPSTGDAPFRGYINVNLSDDDKAAYATWSETDALWLILEAACSDGVHLSVRTDPKGVGFMASATQRRASSPNAGLVVTARGRSASVALGRLLFTLEILGKRPKWEDTQPLADPDRW